MQYTAVCYYIPSLNITLFAVNKIIPEWPVYCQEIVVEKDTLQLRWQLSDPSTWQTFYNCPFMVFQWDSDGTAQYTPVTNGSNNFSSIITENPARYSSDFGKFFRQIFRADSWSVNEPVRLEIFSPKSFNLYFWNGADLNVSFPVPGKPVISSFHNCQFNVIPLS